MKKIFAILSAIVISISSITMVASAESKERVEIKQIGTSGGVPAIKAKLVNGQKVGTYQLVIKNTKTDSTYSQTLINNKEIIFAITNFSDSGTYTYSLQNNGVEVLKGGVNLTSAKRTPTFKASQKGSVLTINASNAADFSGQRIFFKSGSYSNSFSIDNSTTAAKFNNVKGTNKVITFSDTKGKLVTVNLSKVAGDAEKPSTNSNNNSNNTNKPSTGGNSKPSNDNNNSKPNNDSGSGVVAGDEEENTTGSGDNSFVGEEVEYTTETKTNSIKLTLNKVNYELEDYIVAKVSVTNTKYAGQTITVRLGADSSSTVALLDLNEKGKGNSTFKVTVPQPSSGNIVATTYSMSGSKLSATSESYSINGEVEGTKPDKKKKPSGDSPYAEYIALDLRNLEKEQALLSWYDARNIYKFKTRLEVKNETTGTSHKYEVFITDGDSRMKLKLAFDGPGIYTWTLTSGDKLVAKAPFGTPLAVDGSAVSQNGLPVIRTLGNKDAYDSNLDGKTEVGAYDLGEEVGATADDLTEQDQQTATDSSLRESEKNNNLYLYLAILFIGLAIIIVLILIRRRKRNNANDEDRNRFIEYQEDYEEDQSEEDTKSK